MATRIHGQYPTYNFVDKDPAIDKLRTIIEDAGTKRSHIAEASGVSLTCLHGWFDGKTRRPQHATLNAVAGALGWEYDLVRKKGTAPVQRIERLKKKGNGRG